MGKIQADICINYWESGKKRYFKNITLIAIIKITYFKMLVFLTILICNKNFKMTNHVPLLLLGWIVFEVKEKIKRYHHGSADSKIHCVKVKLHPLRKCLLSEAPSNQIYLVTLISLTLNTSFSLV